MKVGDFLGPYEIRSILGAGGMGEVYRARDTRLGREVAIKVLPEEFAKDPDRLARFEREAKAVAAFSHPNILALYDVGIEGSFHYAVLELLEGETLRERLSAGAIPVRKAVEWAAHAAKGLAAAHDKGIVHRDLKPENLFVTRDGQIKILDFGLAGHLSRPDSTDTKSPTVTRHTEPGTLLGTVGYMSPEQVRGKPADPRSDIFSLGAVLYEMVSGRRAFHGESQADVLSAILKEDPPELRASSKPAPPQLNHIVRTCLEKRPEDRLSSAHDLALALQGLSGTEAEPPAPKVAQAPPEGWRKKYRGAIAGSVTLFVFVTIVLAFDVGGLRSKLFPATPSVQPIRSIAVLPLANLSGDPTQEYFSDGMTDAIIADLYKISGFEKVISRTSVMQYKGVKKPLPQIGHELGVEALLEGTVQREGCRVRIGVQLIDAKRDRHLWAESYDREMRDVLNLQSEIAQSVARGVQVALTPSEAARVGQQRKVDPEVYDAYLKAVDLLYNYGDEAAYNAAVALLEGAIQKDSTFAPAFASLGDAYLFLGEGYDQKDAYDKANAALEKALDLDPTLALAHALTGLYLCEAEWDWEGADREFLRAIELGPNNPYVVANYTYFLEWMQRHEESIAMGKRAAALDPIQGPGSAALWDAYSFSGRFEEALAAIQPRLARYPDSPRLLIKMAWTQCLLGRPQEALLSVARLDSVAASVDHADLLRMLGEVYARTGQRPKAEAVLRHLEKMDNNQGRRVALPIAFMRAILGDNDAAMRWLEVGYQRHDPLMSWAYSCFFYAREQKDFPYPTLQNDPRYKALMCKMKFPGACEGKP